MRALAAPVLLALATSALSQTLTDPTLAIAPYLGSASIDNPTGLRFTGLDQGFVIEQGGAVKRFSGGSVSTALTLQVATDGGERGLLGLATHADFAANPFVYLYHSAGTAGGAWIENRLTRYTWNGTSLVMPMPLGTFGSSTDTGNPEIGPNHNAGPLVFGADGKLYGTAGDLNRTGLEQNQPGAPSALTGGVYRLNPDGTIPGDNPFILNTVTDVHRWHSYGLRNSFGIAFDPVTGHLWNTENGPDSYDEINLVSAGMNSGWRPIMGPDSRDPQNAADLVMLNGPTYQDPKFSFASPIGITSVQFLSGSSWGDGYDNAVLVGEANNRRVWLLRLNGNRDGFELAGDLADGVYDDADAFSPFGINFNIVTDIQVGPDGAVYIAALGADTIYRIAPIPEPETWVLTLAGLGLVGWAARRSRGRQAKR